MDVEENEGRTNFALLSEFRNRATFDEGAAINTTELANILLKSFSERKNKKTSLVSASDLGVLLNWLDNTITSIATDIFKQDLDGSVLLNEHTRSAVFRNICGHHLSQDIRNEIRPSRQSVRVAIPKRILFVSGRTSVTSCCFLQRLRYYSSAVIQW
jgi:hypothetical protein